MDAYRIIPRLPSVDEYLHLRKIAGLSPFTPECAQLGLPGSVFAVVVEHQARAVGMGRIIGDGGCIFQITDIAVDPDHQGHGLGKRIMTALMDHVDSALPASAYVSLMADTPADALYLKFGFRHSAPGTVGMVYRRD
ncbi:MAG: GNAT family N-acetyltransferase [Paracoccus sp. (in: a-proteobacteria)]|nr:GNAT family N-acetyltransferase [Paracoccus sp. (in: a-proteobacteria)]